MGYTNYYYMNEVKELPENFVGQLKVLKKIASEKKLDCSFSIGKKKAIVDGPCENLVFKAGKGGFEFCKTAREPYDAIVKAAIMAAVENGVASQWDFDGNVEEEEYLEGLKIAKEAGIKETPPTEGEEKEES